MSSAALDLCRLTVVAPSGVAEVAVPADVALGDLLPTLLSHAADSLPDAGLEHDGWVLQRLGEPPLDEDQTPSGAGLRDGETLYLRPRSAGLPTLDFDDLIDGVSTAMRDRGDRWRDALTRRLFLGLTGVALGLGLGVLLLSGPAGARAVAAVAVAGVLLVSGAVASRALADVPAGVLLGVAALPYAGLAGLLAPAGQTGGALLTGPNVLGAGAAAALVALLAAAAIGVARPLFLAAAVVSGFGAGSGLLSTLTTLWAWRISAILVAVALAFMPMVPMLSFRLAGMQLPPLPTGAENLDQDIEPVHGDTVIARARVADWYMVGLFGTVGAVTAVCLTLLARSTATTPHVLAGLVCVSLLLRSRVLVSGWQRLVLIAPATWGVGLLVVGFAAGAAPSTRTGAVLVGLVTVAGLGLAGARLLPGRRLLPYWGRAADIGESLVGVSIVPAVLAALNVYGFARGLGG